MLFRFFDAMLISNLLNFFLCFGLGVGRFPVSSFLKNRSAYEKNPY